MKIVKNILLVLCLFVVVGVLSAQILFDGSYDAGVEGFLTSIFLTPLILYLWNRRNPKSTHHAKAKDYGLDEIVDSVRPMTKKWSKEMKKVGGKLWVFSKKAVRVLIFLFILGSAINIVEFVWEAYDEMSLKSEFGSVIDKGLKDEDYFRDNAESNEYSTENFLSYVIALSKETYQGFLAAEEALLETDYLEVSSYMTKSSLSKVLVAVEALQRELDKMEPRREHVKSLLRKKFDSYSGLSENERQEALSVLESHQSPEMNLYILAYTQYVDVLVDFYGFMVEASDDYYVGNDPVTSEERVFFDYDVDLELYNSYIDDINAKSVIVNEKLEIYNNKRRSILDGTGVKAEDLDEYYYDQL